MTKTTTYELERLYEVRFTYNWTTVSLAVMAHSEQEAQATAEDIALEEWGRGILEWSDMQIESLN